MEIFLKSKKGKKLYELFQELKKERENVTNGYKEFSEKHGIESGKYIPSKRLGIVPTDNDKVKFDKMLNKPEMGVCRFKKTSKINKDWVEFGKLRKHNFYSEHEFELNIGSLFNVQSHLLSRQGFLYNDCFYLKLKGKYGFEIKESEEYEEIKGSEFYKAIEEAEIKF